MEGKLGLQDRCLISGHSHSGIMLGVSTPHSSLAERPGGPNRETDRNIVFDSSVFSVQSQSDASFSLQHVAIVCGLQEL